MSAILIFSGLALLACTALYVFGLPYVVYGPAAVKQKLAQEEYRLLGGALVTAAMAICASPIVFTALISGSETAQVFASTLTGLSWSL